MRLAVMTLGLPSLWFSLGAFMQQGIDITPRSISGRIVGEQRRGVEIHREMKLGGKV